MVKEFTHEADVDATVIVVGLLGDVLVDVVWEGGDALCVYCCLSVWGIGGDELPVLWVEGDGLLSRLFEAWAVSWGCLFLEPSEYCFSYSSVVDVRAA